MTTFLLIVHVLVCFILIVVVLLQAGKGAEIGATFGSGGSQTLFGSRGAGTFLTKVTAVAGTIFMLTSLALAIMITGVTGGSVVKEPAKQEAPAQAPAAPAGQPFAPAPGGPASAPAKPAFPAPQGGK